MYYLQLFTVYGKADIWGEILVRENGTNPLQGSGVTTSRDAAVRE